MIAQIQKDAVKAAELSMVSAVVGVEIITFVLVTWWITS